MKNKVLQALAFLIVCFLQYYLASDFYLKSDSVSNVITFLSIAFGFYITSLSIFTSSKFISEMYKFVDKHKTSQTILHQLINKYQSGLFLNLLTIVYFMIISVTIDQDRDYKISFSNLMALPAGALVIFNVIYFHSMLQKMIRVVLQEAKKS